MIINNIEDLATHVGVPDCFEGRHANAIARMLFKYTECGCCFDHDEAGVTVAGYAEGADAECPDHRLNYPFDSDAWDQAVAIADDEGVEMWNEWNNVEDYE